MRQVVKSVGRGLAEVRRVKEEIEEEVGIGQFRRMKSDVLNEVAKAAGGVTDVLDVQGEGRGGAGSAPPKSR
jgi:hypothetical protein